MIYMPENFKYLEVVSEIKEIKVLDNKTIKGIHARVQEAVMVSSCPSLTEASFYTAPITRFDMDGVPNLTYLNLEGCTNLSKEVPALFDQEGLTVKYEERYKYTYGDGPYTIEETGTKFNYTDKGYGFWYKGEPNRGYHKDPR